MSLLGGIESRGGVLAATQDENTVLFTKEQAPRFAELRDTIEQRAAATRQPQGYSIAPASASLSEELTRLADLRDRGVLSEDEFANEKQALFARRDGPPKVETTAETSAPTATTRPVEAPAKMGLGKKAGIGCLGVLALIIVLASLGSNVEKEGGKEPAADATSTSSDVATKEVALVPAVDTTKRVTAVELARAYEANEAAAQEQYGDQPLLVTGQVEGVTLDFSDDPVVQLKGTNMFLNVQAALDADSKAEASSLSKGTTVTLRCQEVGEVIGTPMLKECAL